jgi:hypothetical protein
VLDLTSKFAERSTGFYVHRFETRLQAFERGGILRGLTLRGAQSLDVGLEGPDILGHFLRRAEHLGPRRALLCRDHRSGWRRNQDAGSWRRSRLVRDYVASEGGGIKLELLEPHAPELKWAHWKQYEMPNFCPKDFAELSAFARAKLKRTPRRKTLVAAFWKQAELPFQSYPVCQKSISERIDGLSPRQPPGRAVLHQPHTSYSLYAGQDVVEVLTKCRVQRLWRGDVRFVDARRY